MTPEERVRVLSLDLLEGSTRLGWNVADEQEMILRHLRASLSDQREEIARMVEGWVWHGQGGHCVDVYPEIAKAIREGAICNHQWVDIRNQYIESGEMCRKCHALREGNETTDGKKGEAPGWKFQAPHGLNPG